jgi:hypothetical protein
MFSMNCIWRNGGTYCILNSIRKKIKFEPVFFLVSKYPDPAEFDNAQNLFPRSLRTSESYPAIYKIYHKVMCSHNEEKQAEKQ